MSLVNELIKGLLPEEEKKKVVAVYGGGFKPPTSGHFEVVKQALKENPEIDEMIILIGGKPRNGITPDESILIWDIYKTYLPFKVEVKYTSVPPIKGIYNYAKEHPDEEVLFIIGAREGNEEDFKDIASRTTSLDKYPNLNLRTIVTQGGVSGTAARNASKISLDKFKPFVPSELSDEEVEQVYNIVADKITEGRKKKKDPKKGTGKKPEGSKRRLYTDEDPKDTIGIKFSTRQDIVDTLNKTSFKAKSHARQSQIINLIHQRVRAAYGRAKDPKVKKRLKTGLDYITKKKEASKKKTQRLKKLNENASYSKEINIKEKIAQLTNHMIDKGMNIEPLPSLEFVDGDSKNASDFLGKTAYYDPNKQHIVLYTEGRHPKDIVRSYAHEMIHHIQNLEDRLGNISTTNTQEDDNLNNIEAEANLKGTMTFRNWTDSLNEGKQVGLLYHITTPEKLKKILDSNTLKGSYISWDGGDTDFLGISTTRNKNFLYGDNKIQIVLNGDKISNNYKIQPYDYWGREYNIPDEPQIKDEDEEIIKVGKDGLKNVKNYIIKINDFTDSLNENILNEIGDLSQAPYKWKTFSKPEGSNDPYSYYDFSTDNGTKYQVIFNREEFGKTVNYDMSFVAKGKDGKEFSADALTGGNEPLKIMSTIVDITREQIKKAGDVEFITFEPTKGKTGEEGAKGNIRSKLYKIIIKKNFPKAKVSGTDTVVVDMTSYKNNGLNEAIVGEKIECDNCGWSWNIVDGGDDLFICHKCGHDNKPISEKKNKDPFGLNAYARELAMGLEENKKVMDYKIYCDMDGVLADFERGYKELTGVDLQGEFQKGDDFWDPISEKGVGFWAGLKWMPDGQELWDYLKPYKPDLLSAPSREDSSRIGKHVWVKHKIPGTKLILRYAKQKQELATPESILIDDRQVNIDQWEAAGGIGILHTSTANTIKQLKQLGL